MNDTFKIYMRDTIKLDTVNIQELCTTDNMNKVNLIIAALRNIDEEPNRDFYYEKI
jgi:hypothetical protein